MVLASSQIEENKYKIILRGLINFIFPGKSDQSAILKSWSSFVISAGTCDLRDWNKSGMWMSK